MQLLALRRRLVLSAKELKKSRLLSCDFEALVVSDENDLMINVEVHVSIASRTAAKRVFLGCNVSAVSNPAEIARLINEAAESVR